MKHLLLCLLLCFVLSHSIAQKTKRNIQFKTFGIDRDSVVLPLNNNYYLIEDSCSEIRRYAHFNFEKRIFFGKFRDVSRLDSNLVVAEGTYNNDGLKDGEFISRYLNGKLQAKGNFRNNQYDGKWEMYYEDGKPQVKFEVLNGAIQITDAWKADGSKTVDNGKGNYSSQIDNLIWKGKLSNGRPDGTWNLVNADDINESAISTEHFKKGEFKNGIIGESDYNDNSRIMLVSPYKLPFVNIEKILISAVSCNGARIDSPSKHIVNAQYAGGFESLSEAIKTAVSPYLNTVDLRGMDNFISIEGEVSERGDLINLKDKDSFREDIARGIILRLNTVPRLHPASVDGKPIKQKFKIVFTIRNSSYEFTYHFLPIQLIDNG